jgi:putative N6-adenine-specific DNA methylase
VHSEVFDHSGYVALKVKDAIVDQIRNAKKRRPNIKPNNPDFLVHVHVSGNDCSVSLDSSGESLHRRGYRLDGSIAPLNEALAAGMIMLTGWKGETNFVDFMCGSGTLLIEAAMIAHNIPAGAYRQKFGFEKWNDYDDELFQKIKDSEDEIEFNNLITGCEISKASFFEAQRNIKNAYLHKRIELHNQSFENLVPPPSPGIVITNPPYGERLSMNDLNSFYKTIGNKLKRDFAGYTAWIISSNPEATKFIGLHPAQKIKLYNGSLECKYQKFELYEGSKKK